MKKEDYTHVRVPKKLHTVLKKEAELKNMSIADYIANLISRVRAFEALAAGQTTYVNMSGCGKTNYQKGFKW